MHHGQFGNIKQTTNETANDVKELLRRDAGRPQGTKSVSIK